MTKSEVNFTFSTYIKTNFKYPPFYKCFILLFIIMLKKPKVDSYVKLFKFNDTSFYRIVTKMGQEILTFVFAWIFSSVLIDESETSKS